MVWILPETWSDIQIWSLNAWLKDQIPRKFTKDWTVLPYLTQCNFTILILKNAALSLSFPFTVLLCRSSCWLISLIVLLLFLSDQPLLMCFQFHRLLLLYYLSLINEGLTLPSDSPESHLLSHPQQISHSTSLFLRARSPSYLYLKTIKLTPYRKCYPSGSYIWGTAFSFFLFFWFYTCI